ncbi:unnamed protein product [Protopolystoma xenopodis]|uniref:Uncharacterized protein n=1 Tax=Protopolystoma xenopodis TaxID=117903 RepID=A0A3S5CGZ9_9PLAT|nr:unnamed protein product [Protopolystoma xenopodis]
MELSDRREAFRGPRPSPVAKACSAGLRFTSLLACSTVGLCNAMATDETGHKVVLESWIECLQFDISFCSTLSGGRGDVPISLAPTATSASRWAYKCCLDNQSERFVLSPSMSPVAGTKIDSQNPKEKMIALALYAAIGLSVFAMCFKLMEEEAVNKIKRIGRWLGLLKAPTSYASSVQASGLDAANNLALPAALSYEQQGPTNLLSLAGEPQSVHRVASSVTLATVSALQLAPTSLGLGLQAAGTSTPSGEIAEPLLVPAPPVTFEANRSDGDVVFGQNNPKKRRKNEKISGRRSTLRPRRKTKPHLPALQQPNLVPVILVHD